MPPRWFRRHAGDRLAARAVKDYERSRDEWEVVRDLEEALSLGLEAFPRDRAYTYLGAAYEDLGLHDEAERAYEAALAVHPENSTALSNLGLVVERKADLARARILYTRAIEANPRSAYAHNNLGVLLHRQGMHREALPLLQRAAELDPRLATAYANLARCHAHLGEFAAAQEAFLRASRVGYDALDELRRELLDLETSLPKVYFDPKPFFRLAEGLLPWDEGLERLFQRAIHEPEALYDALIASGRRLFLTSDQVMRALPWLLLCDELCTRGLAVRGEERPFAEWLDAVLSTMQRRGLSTPPREQVHEHIRALLEEDDDRSALDTLFEVLTLDEEIVLLRLWETAEQTIVVPLHRADWFDAGYPSYEGAAGPGMVGFFGTEPRPEPMH